MRFAKYVSNLIAVLAVFSGGTAYGASPDGCIRTELERITRVNSVVTGLYASIPRQAATEAGQLKIATHVARGKSGTLEMETELTFGDATGSARRSFTSDKRQMTLSSAYLKDSDSKRIPSFISVPGTIPLVSGRGIPTLVYVTLQDMRLAEIPYGGLRRTDSYVTNIRTALELLRSKPIRKFLAEHPGSLVPTKLIEDEFLSTQTGQFVDTVLTQSGHKITRVKVSRSSPEATFESLRPLISQDDKELQRLLADGDSIGLQQEVPYGFSVELLLEPLP